MLNQPTKYRVFFDVEVETGTPENVFDMCIRRTVSGLLRDEAPWAREARISNILIARVVK